MTIYKLTRERMYSDSLDLERYFSTMEAAEAAAAVGRVNPLTWVGEGFMRVTWWLGNYRYVISSIEVE